MRVVNIAAFHLFLARGGLAVAAFLVAAVIYLAVVHAGAFRALHTVVTDHQRRDHSPGEGAVSR